MLPATHGPAPQRAPFTSDWPRALLEDPSQIAMGTCPPSWPAHCCTCCHLGALSPALARHLLQLVLLTAAQCSGPQAMYRAQPVPPWALPGASLLLPLGSPEVNPVEGDHTKPSHTWAPNRPLWRGASEGAQLWGRFGASLWLGYKIGG